MLLRQRILACRRYLLPVSSQRQPNRDDSGVGGFSPISTLLPVRNIQFHGVALLSSSSDLSKCISDCLRSSTGSWRTDGSKVLQDIFDLATANASGISKNAKKKLVKKESGLILTSKKDEIFGQSYSEDILGLATANASGISKNARKKQVKKETGLGFASKNDESLGELYMYIGVVVQGLLEYYGFFSYLLLSSWTRTIWKNMQTFFAAEIQKMDIANIYFPMFENENALQKEDHIEGLAQEIGRFTEFGVHDLADLFTICRTTETNVHSCFSKRISTHEDLPLKLNLWYNFVPLKDRHGTPFIRSREFLRQDGYTAFATKEEADNEILEILELYQKIYEEYLAIPVVKGWKSALEKTAGVCYSTCVEVFIPKVGRGKHGAIAHCLGQNFAKKFGIDFVNEKGEKCMVYQNFWTFNSGVFEFILLVHGDDKGLVLPPKVAVVQIIIIPVPHKDSDVKAISAACSSAVQTLRAAGFRAEHDFRDNYSPDWKNFNWERNGVPLRIEISPEDIVNNQVRIVRRDTGSTADVPTTNLVEHVRDLLLNIHESMFNVAKAKRDACKMIVYTWEEFMTALNDKKLILAPWCDDEDVEEDVKARTKSDLGAAKILCLPFDQPNLPEGTLCFASGKLAKKWTYWGLCK